MRSCFWGFALVCACLAVVAPVARAAEPAEEYQLSLERPEAFGHYYEFKSEVYRSTRVIETRDGEPHSDDNTIIEASIVGTAWVSDADGNGDIVEVVVYPNEYTGQLNGEDVELTLGERLFVQSQDGELKVYSSAGHTMPADVIRVLNELLAFMVESDENELAKNDMFSLDQKRKPGQSWQGDHALLAASLNRVWDIQAEPKQIKSAMKFVEVDTLFKEDSATLDLSIELKDFAVPALAPRGLSIEQSTGSIDVKRTLPLRPNGMSGKVAKQVDLSVTATGELPGQGRVEVKTVTSLKSQAEYQLK